MRKTMGVSMMLGAMLLAGGSGAAQAAPEPDAWRFELTPYLFGASLSGTTGIGQVRADVDLSFGDLVDNLDSGFMAMFEARRGKWGFGVDGVYFKLGDQKTAGWQGPGGIGSANGTLEATMTEQVYQFWAGYRIAQGRTRTEVVGAARYTQLDVDLDLVVTTGGLLPGGTRSLSEGKRWWDAVIGLRSITPFAERWEFVSYADIGAGGSDLTYQFLLGLNWQASKALKATGGYRYFYQDYADGAFVWDMAAHGFYLGLGIGF